MMTRRTLLRSQLAGIAVGVPLLGMFAQPALAAPEVFSRMGVALGGADPVGYFTDQSPMSGRPEFGLMWRGAIWQFASLDHRNMFEMDPSRFCPQYGGYCAFAMAQGRIASTVPEAWQIHDGRLYLTNNIDVLAVWRRDADGFVAMADPYWPSILAD